jgi:hypothetical protein
MIRLKVRSDTFSSSSQKAAKIHLLVILQLLQVFDDVISFSGGGVKKFAPIRKYNLGCLSSVGILEIRPDLVCAVAHRGIQPSAIVSRLRK